MEEEAAEVVVGRSERGLFVLCCGAGLLGLLVVWCRVGGRGEGMVMRGPERVDSLKRRPGAAWGSSAQSLKRPSMPREASRFG
jgi:hypothetical protein